MLLLNHSSGAALHGSETTPPALPDWGLSSDFSPSIIRPEWEIFTVTIKIMKVNFKWHSNTVTCSRLSALSPPHPLHVGSCNLEHHSLRGDYSCSYSAPRAPILQAERKRFQVAGPAPAPGFQESSIFWVHDGARTLSGSWNGSWISFLSVAFTNCNEYGLCLRRIIVRGLLIRRSLFYYTSR